MNKPLTIYTPEGMEPDQGAIDQINSCMEDDSALAGVLSADNHKGYSMPIGGTVAYEGMISPTGVGYDIGCGNMYVSTSLQYSEISKDLPKLMDEIASRISFGMGLINNEKADHPVLDKIWQDAPTQKIRDLQSKAAKQLGTVGGGNHYVDLFREAGTDRVGIGVHFGSRGFGHTIATGFLALAEGKAFTDKPSKEDMDSKPVLLPTDSPLGYSYIEAMNLAGEYAYAGRETVVKKVLEILGNPTVVDTVHNHHNFAWEEEHLIGSEFKTVWVVRKGATPSFPGQKGFVGSSMGESSYIIEGNEVDDGDTNNAGPGDLALWSSPHGAGRVMSRTKAKGKERKRYYDPNSDWVQLPNTQAPSEDEINARGLKRKWIREVDGLINWSEVKKELKFKNIHVRGGDADEAPGAYKRLDKVLAAHSSYVDIVKELIPIGVCMAGPDIKDAYKD